MLIELQLNDILKTAIKENNDVKVFYSNISKIDFKDTFF